jgi:HNH endonuclease
MVALEAAMPELLVATCACGCGKVPPVLERDRLGRGYLQGDQPRFITGHNLRVQKRTAAGDIVTVVAASYCECGCGSVTPILRKNRDGRRRGERARRLRGHVTRRFSIPDGLLFDECDREFVLSAAWSVTSAGYAYSGRLGLLHRAIMKAPPGSVVDHINGIRLDDRRCNLRLVTHQENLQNHISPPRSNTGHYGVTFDANRGRYCAYATLSGRRVFLGRFRDLDSAVDARRRFCEEHMKGYIAR